VSLINFAAASPPGKRMGQNGAEGQAGTTSVPLAAVADACLIQRSIK